MADEWEDSPVAMSANDSSRNQSRSFETREWKNSARSGRRDDGYNNRGGGGYNNRKDDGYGNRRDDGYNNRGGGGYNNRQDDGYGNRRDEGYNNRGGGGYNNRQDDGYGNRRDDGYNRRNEQNSRRENESYKSGNEDAMVIYVPQQMVGKIIGRGGCKIKELQDESGARISIDKSYQGDDAAVNIKGSKESQDRAKALIEELTGDQSHSSYTSSRNTNYEDSSHQVESQVENQSSQAAAPAYNPDPIDFGDFDWTKANEEHEKFQKERWKNLKPMTKNFYEELPEVRDLTEEKIAEIRANRNNIECRRVFENENEEFKVPNPITSFHQAFHNYPEVLDEIKKAGFEEPSPIQCQAWPILLSGKDMIGIAQTGTGKTLAFLLPAMIHIDGQPVPRNERAGPNVLIMAPTRELAQQISKEVGKYEYRGIKAVCLYGGGSRQEQMAKVDKGVQIVIATPGRLNDLVACGSLNVKEVTYLVLDEADRMLDMGFEPQIRKTLLDVRPDRQTVMTSATWPQGVRRLAQSYMCDPIQVCVGSLDLAATHTVKQTIIICKDEEKTDILKEFFENMNRDDKVIVFFMKKTRVDDLSSELALSGVHAQSIHGGRDQIDREQALEDIKSGDVKILLATDVASRGIDIEDITHVFNYDFPRDIEEYVHRVGRTGRAGRTGESISLISRGDWALARELIAILEEASQEIPEELYSMADRYEAWRKRKDEERGEARSYGGGSGRYGGGGRGGRGGGRGGRRDKW